MPTVLLAWELGGGLAHVLQLLPLAEGLVGQGHRVYVALRDLARGAAFGRSGVSLLQAPLKLRGAVPFPRPDSFAHLLADVGFGDERELFALTSAWRNLYRLTRPDLIVFDHSPTALLASRGLPTRRVVIGPGFFCPPDLSPFPSLRPAGADPEALLGDEVQILGRVNRLLANWKQPPVQRLAQLYAEVDETFLTTFPELDPYPGRGAARYRGPVLGSGGKAPIWPDGRGKRVYAYLKPSASLPVLLKALTDRGHPTLVSVDGVGRAERNALQSPTLRFETERLDLAQIGRECDLAVLNGNHGTTCAMLLAGRPTLQLPLTLEQSLTARAVCGLGAAEAVSAKRGKTSALRQDLDAVFARWYAEAAGRFALLHADFDPQREGTDMLSRVGELLPVP